MNMVSKARGNLHDCDTIALHLLNKLCNQKVCDQPYAKLASVRRNLFGFHESNKSSDQLLDQHLIAMAEKASKEWNFDFLNELPQEGRYVWQRVPECDVPLWYTTVTKATFKESYKQKEIDIDSDQEDACALLKGEKENELESRESSNKKASQKTCSKKPRLIQTSMKDFTRVQKRRSSRRLLLKRLDNKLRRHHLVYCSSAVTSF